MLRLRFTILILVIGLTGCTPPLTAMMDANEQYGNGISIVLNQYYLDNGRYPYYLDALKPDYLPDDTPFVTPYGGQEFEYELWSVDTGSVAVLRYSVDHHECVLELMNGAISDDWVCFERIAY